MQFRKISESMTDHEAEALLHILLPGSKMKEITYNSHYFFSTTLKKSDWKCR